MSGMKFQFWNYMSKLKEERKLLTVAVIILAALSVILAIILMQTIKTRTVVVLPPKIDQEFWVSGNRLSTTYFEQVGYYLADRILTVNPRTASNSFDSIVQFLTTDARTMRKIREQLKTQADIIIAEQYYQAFYPERIILDEKNKTLRIVGKLRRDVGTIVTELSPHVEFSYDVQNGRLFITSIKVDQ